MLKSLCACRASNALPTNEQPLINIVNSAPINQAHHLKEDTVEEKEPPPRTLRRAAEAAARCPVRPLAASGSSAQPAMAAQRKPPRISTGRRLPVSLLLSSTLVLVLLSLQQGTYGQYSAAASYAPRTQDDSQAALAELLDELERDKLARQAYELAEPPAASAGASEYQLAADTGGSPSYLDYFLAPPNQADDADAAQRQLDMSELASLSHWNSPAADAAADDLNQDNQPAPTDLLSYLANQAKLAENELLAAEANRDFYQVDQANREQDEEEAAPADKRKEAPFTTLLESEDAPPAKQEPVKAAQVARNSSSELANGTRSQPESAGAPTAAGKPRQPEVASWSMAGLFHDLYQGLSGFLDSKLTSWAHLKPALQANATETTSAPVEPTIPSSISVPAKKKEVAHPRNHVASNSSTRKQPQEPDSLDSSSLSAVDVATGGDSLAYLMDEPRRGAQQVSPATEEAAAATDDDGQEVSATSPHGLPRVSLLRQSSLTPPVYLGEQQREQLLMRSSSPGPQRQTLTTQFVDMQPAGRRLGSASSRSLRQHGSTPDDGGAYDNSDEGRPMFADDDSGPPPSHHGAYLSRLRAGDHLFGPYGAYYDHRHPAEQVGPLAKSNDIYFLVMVVAFCAMAIAVVLSAGLFTYRIQQSRKTTSDQDYPTYGVVGPNNMTGKCGPAAFVGGYFGGPPGAGVGGLVGVSGSGVGKGSKGLPDYGDSGTAVSSSRTASTKSNKSALEQPAAGVGNSMSVSANNRSVSGFMVDNQSAARMYHYQHQKQQMIISDKSAAGRHTSASDLDSEDENEDGSYTVYECPGLASAHEMEIKNPLFNDDQTP